jgi:cell division control protein 42
MPFSFDNIKEKWIPEINFYCPKTPFLLVGLQIDLREKQEIVDKLKNNRTKPISKTQGERLARTINAVKYVECSSYTQVFFFIFCFYLIKNFKTNIRY